MRHQRKLMARAVCGRSGAYRKNHPARKRRVQSNRCARAWIYRSRFTRGHLASVASRSFFRRSCRPRTRGRSPQVGSPTKGSAKRCGRDHAALSPQVSSTYSIGSAYAPVRRLYGHLPARCRGRRHSAGIVPADRRRRFCAPHFLCQRRQPPAGAHFSPDTGARHTRGARSATHTDYSSVAKRKRAPFARRRRAGTGVGPSWSPPATGYQPERYTANRRQCLGDYAGLARVSLYPDRFPTHGRSVRADAGAERVAG